jgi:glycerol-3-phosphate acyltransferase PlsY
MKMTAYVLLAAAALAGYLIGSVNLSIIFSKMKGTDIRKMGSGNAGSTNTLRTMGKGFAAVVFIFDILKGFLPTFILCRLFMQNQACIYAFFAVIGHCFPLYFGFKGGKGVATAIGAVFALSVPTALMVLAEFVIVLLLFRYVSVASIVAAFNLPFFAYYFTDNLLLLECVCCIALIVIAGHKSNIIRVREGTENALFGKKKK